MKNLIKKLISLIIIFFLLLGNFLPLFSKHPPLVKESSAFSCNAKGLGDLRAYLASKVGGVALDQAAVFLADMSDLTGAYYDQDQDRIVFMGQKGAVSIPKFDKDDLAVAIRTLVFKNQIPMVSIEPKDPNNRTAGDMLNVVYLGGIEDTRFGQVMVDADYKMKQYAQGYDTNGNVLTSSVPGYKSFFDRWLEKNPDPTIQNNSSRFWINPQLVTLKKDDNAKSFVFDQVKMQILTEGLRSTNDPEWNQAAIEFSQQQTDLYDEFSKETPSYYEAKQLAKIVGVVKWITDNGIANNFEWARDYQPKYIATPREIKRLTTPWRDMGGGWQMRMTGGVDYKEPNTYNPDDGVSSSLKNSSEAVGAPTEEVHWTFTNNGQQYDAVAVAADAFRSIGAFSTSETDILIPSESDIPFTFTRTYSSFSNRQKGLGIGWDFMPVKLYDNKVGWILPCSSGALPGNHPWKLAFQLPSGRQETFTFTSCDTGYSPDKPEFHSKVFHNSDSTFTVKTRDQIEYKFGANFKLIEIKDRNGNEQFYTYDNNGKLGSITNSRLSSIYFSYSNNLINQVSERPGTEWGSPLGRSFYYSYDTLGRLISVKDPKGNITKYEYDNNNKLVKIIDRTGATITENTYTPEAKVASQKNTSGTTVNFAYDESARTVSAIDNNGRTGRLAYDDRARVLENTDTTNNSIKYTYGQEYSPLTTTDKLGNKLTFTYDANGNATSITLPTSKKTNYEYNTSNFVTRILDERYGATPKETKFIYDSKNNLTQKNEVGLITNYTYDSFGGMASLTNPLNQKTSWTRNGMGNPLTITDNSGNTTSSEYDSLGRLIREIDPDGKTTSYAYDVNNNVISKSNSLGQYTYIYDAGDRLEKEIDPNNAAIEYSYNSTSFLASVRDQANSLTSYGYDSYQNLISKTDALNRITNYQYDARDRQIQSTTTMGNVTKWEHDANGNIRTITDANGKTISYVYDNLDRLIKINYPNATSATYTYDDRDNLIKITEPAGATTFTYDVFDRLTNVTNPYLRSLTYTYNNAGRITRITYPDGRNATYGYDGAGRLSEVLDWNGSKTIYSYNKNGLLASKSLPNGISANYTYDGGNFLLDLSYSKSGSTLARFLYTRNSLGNITKVTEEGSFFSAVSPTPTPTPTPTLEPTPTLSPTIAPTPTSTPTPTPTGSTPTPTPTGVIPTPTQTPAPTPTPTPSLSGSDLVITGVSLIPAVPTAGRSFNMAVQVKNQGNLSTGFKLVSVAAYYDLSSPPTYTTAYNVSRSSFVNISAGGSTTINLPGVFFSRGPHSIRFLVDRGKVVAETNENNNTFGPVNLNVARHFNILPIVASLFNIKKAYAQEQQFLTSFEYDTLGRIKSALYPNNASYEYNYDAVGNKSYQVVNGSTTYYSGNEDGQMLQSGPAGSPGTRYTYDPNGNLIEKNFNPGVKTFSYNFENKLSSFTSLNTTTYKYDGLGNRLEKTVGTIATRYINDLSKNLVNVLAETNSLNTILNWYIYGNGLISQGSFGISSRLYPLVDGQGNVRFVTNYNGAQVKRYDYDPFGNVSFEQGSTNTNYKFAGEQLDPETQMYYLRARHYDPSVGRFTTRDPIKGIRSNPQTQNAYVYSANNPVNLSDPSGQAWFLYLLDAAGTTLDAISLTESIADCDWGGAALSAASLGIPFISIGGIKVVSKIDDVIDATKRFRRLNDSEIREVERIVGQDIHEIKGPGGGRLDLFKDSNGNVYIKPKDGSGPGEPIGVNLHE